MILATLKLRNGIAVKTVDFMGNGLLIVKDSKGVIWTGVNSFCRGIGLNKNERDRQVKNVQSDEVLKMGYVKFAAGYLSRTMKRLYCNWTMFSCGLPKFLLHQT